MNTLRYLLIFLTTNLFISQFVDDFKGKIEEVQIASCDSTKIEGRIWFPEKRTSDKLVIAVTPCLVTTFKPMSYSEELRFDLMLRDKLLEKGITYFEFAGRKDSITKYGRRFPLSTMFTKAKDLEATLAYVRSRGDLANKKIVLIGQSEGGATSMIVASEDKEISAVVLLSTPGVSGYEFMRYQKRCKDTLFMTTFGYHSETFEMLNTISSINKKKYGQSIEEFRRFEKDMFGPFENIIHQNCDYDTIAVHIVNYLRKKWNMEDELTRKFHKNFDNYCQAHHYLEYIQPEQIALWKWEPERYIPKITCPIIAVYGTLDKNVEFSTSIKNIQKLMNKGGNNNFTSLILKDYDHLLENHEIRPSIQESSVIQVVDWIIRQ